MRPFIQIRKDGTLNALLAGAMYWANWNRGLYHTGNPRLLLPADAQVGDLISLRADTLAHYYVSVTLESGWQDGAYAVFRVRADDVERVDPPFDWLEE